MKKTIASIFLILICYFGYGQTYPVQQNLGSGTTLVKNPNYGGFQGGLIPYTFGDTTLANTALSYLKNYCGALVYTTDVAALWYRSCYAGVGGYRWVMIDPSGAPSSSNSWIVGGNSGLFTSPVDPQYVGTKTVQGFGFKTSDVARLTIPASGIARTSDAAYKYLMFDTSGSVHLMAYGDGGSGSGGWGYTGTVATLTGASTLATDGNTFAINDVTNGNMLSIDPSGKVVRLNATNGVGQAYMEANGDGVDAAFNFTATDGSTLWQVKGEYGNIIYTAAGHVISNSNSNTPDASAILDIISTTKGLLIPRLNTTEQNAIGTPVNGLTIYNTDSSDYVVYKSSEWRIIGSGGGSTPTWQQVTDIGNTTTNDIKIGDNDPPNANFHVKTTGSNQAIFESSDDEVYVKFWGTAVSALSFSTDAGVTQTAIIENQGGNLGIDVGNGNNINLHTNGSGGKVGINYITPDSTLDVAGSMHVSSGVRLSGIPSGVGTRALRIDATGNITSADTTTGGGQQARVSTQFDKTADVTLANVTGLTVNVAASGTYRFEAKLYTTSNVAGGVKAAIAGTATATAIVYEGITTDAGLSTQGRSAALAGAVGAVTAVTAGYITITGTITVNAAGTLTVQFAQNASNGTASSVLVGSTFVVTEML